jgi:hypothetical protein
VHGFNVRHGEDGSGLGSPGLRCTTCHLSSNSNVLHGPPGVENWRLAPAETVWLQQCSAEICAQIKARHATAAARSKMLLFTSATTSSSAGAGTRVAAPGSAEATYTAIGKRATAGAPCPRE